MALSPYLCNGINFRDMLFLKYKNIIDGEKFGFVHLSDAFTTGSSIMPQKKNPDMAELVRGKTGRVYGDMISLFTTLKGLPLAYNKDMQEDKECVFDAVDTAVMCLKVFSGMIEGMQANPERMKKAAQTGFINATDLADYLVGRGLPFREAYKKSGELVALCTRLGTVLDELPLEEYKKASGLFESDVYDAIDLDACCPQNERGRDCTRAGGCADSLGKRADIEAACIMQDLVIDTRYLL